MSKNTAAPASKTKASGKMTRAEFLVALDEANATVAKQIEAVRESQRASQQERANHAETTQRLLLVGEEKHRAEMEKIHQGTRL